MAAVSPDSTVQDLLDLSNSFELVSTAEADTVSFKGADKTTSIACKSTFECKRKDTEPKQSAFHRQATGCSQRQLCLKSDTKRFHRSDTTLQRKMAEEARKLARETVNAQPERLLESLEIEPNLETENQKQSKRPLFDRIQDVEKGMMVAASKKLDPGQTKFSFKFLCSRQTVNVTISNQRLVAELILEMLNSASGLGLNLWSSYVIIEGVDILYPELMGKEISHAFNDYGVINTGGVTTLHISKGSNSGITRLELELQRVDPATEQPYLPKYLQTAKQLEARARTALLQLQAGHLTIPMSEFLHIINGLENILQQIRSERESALRPTKLFTRLYSSNRRVVDPYTPTREERYIANLKACFEIFKSPHIGTQNAIFDPVIKHLLSQGAGADERHRELDAEALLSLLEKTITKQGVNRASITQNECLYWLVQGAKFNLLTRRELERLKNCQHPVLTDDIKAHIDWQQFQMMQPAKAEEATEDEMCMTSVKDKKHSLQVRTAKAKPHW